MHQENLAGRFCNFLIIYTICRRGRSKRKMKGVLQKKRSWFLQKKLQAIFDPTLFSTEYWLSSGFVFGDFPEYIRVFLLNHSESILYSDERGHENV